MLKSNGFTKQTERIYFYVVSTTILCHPCALVFFFFSSVDEKNEKQCEMLTHRSIYDMIQKSIKGISNNVWIRGEHRIHVVHEALDACSYTHTYTQYFQSEMIKHRITVCSIYANEVYELVLELEPGHPSMLIWQNQSNYQHALLLSLLPLLLLLLLLIYKMLKSFGIIAWD